MIQASGLTADSVLHCTSLLRKDPILATSFGKAAKLVDDVIFLIAIEMDSLSKDILYWNNLRHSNPMYIKYMNYYVSVYRSFRSSVYNMVTVGAPSSQEIGNKLVWTPFVTGYVEIEDRLMALRKKFYELTMLLAHIYEAASDLKYIYLCALSKSLEAGATEDLTQSSRCDEERLSIAREFMIRALSNVLRQFERHPVVMKCRDELRKNSVSSPHTPTGQPNKSAALQPNPISPDDSKDESVSPRMRQLSFDDIAAMLPSPSTLTRSLRDKTHSVLELLRGEHSDDMDSDSSNNAQNSPGDEAAVRAKVQQDSQLLRSHIKALAQLVRSFQHARDGYPLQSVQSSMHRPHATELYWLPNLCMFLCSVVCIHRGIDMYSSGRLQALALKFKNWVEVNWQEHMIEPMQDLFGEIFDTMSRKKDAIVTREDIMQVQHAISSRYLLR
jgi:hypothetical protein